VVAALDKPKAVLSQESFDEKIRNKIGDAGQCQEWISYNIIWQQSSDSSGVNLT
jgi:hypothetical protein